MVWSLSLYFSSFAVSIVFVFVIVFLSDHLTDNPAVEAVVDGAASHIRLVGSQIATILKYFRF